MLMELTGWDYYQLRRQPIRWKADLCQVITVRSQLQADMVRTAK